MCLHDWHALVVAVLKILVDFPYGFEYETCDPGGDYGRMNEPILLRTSHEDGMYPYVGTSIIRGSWYFT
jgi:hypothetical protein